MNYNLYKVYIFVLILLAYGIKLKAQPLIPTDFTEMSSVPIVYSKEWRELNYSGNEFAVEIIGGKLAVKKREKKNRCELTVSNGKYIGNDKGEFGGLLSFVPNDSTKKVEKIKDGNINFISAYNNKIYFIEGLAHGASSKGAMFELDTTNNKNSYIKVVDFDDAPMACTIYQDQLFVATFGNFYILKNLELELVFKDTFWSSLYPNSIAILDDKNVFLGIRGGIVKLDLVEKVLTFYKYKE